MGSYHRPTSRGFTLIESMMAVVVVSFAVAALSTVLYAAVKNADAVADSNAAITASQNDMEVLLSSKLDDLSPANGVTSSESVAASSLSTSTHPVTHVAAINYISRSGTQTARDIAIIKCVSTTSDGQTVTFQRLVTRAGASQ